MLSHAFDKPNIKRQAMMRKGTQTERQRTQQHYYRPEKSGSDTIKGGRDTVLEAKAQLHSDNIT